MKRDQDSRYGVFADITEGMDEVPAMPSMLTRFDREITRAEVHADARLVFLVWLRGDLDGFYTRMNTDKLSPCSDVDLIDSFFPEWPDPNDFDEFESSREFRRKEAEAEIETALAKKACGECPLRVQCLARALKADAIYPDGEPVEIEGVFGGWGANARTLILNKVRETRRSYQRGVREQRDNVDVTDRKGMSPAAIQLLEEKARELLLL